MDDTGVATVELVGGGLAEWPSGTGPRGETIAAAAFVDASGAEHLIDLPHRFHEVGSTGWTCRGVWERDPLALTITVERPLQASLRIPLDAARHGALVDAILRDGGIYVCPTTPRHGLNARLARDHSFHVEVDRGFAEEWRARRGRR